MSLSSNESLDGNHKAALAYLEEVRGLDADLDDRRRASYMFDLAYSYRETGDYEAAVRTGIISLELFRRAEAERETGALENDLSMSYLALGNSSRAAEMAASARTRFERLDDKWWLAFVLDSQARIALARGAADEAARYAEEALGLARSNRNAKASVDALLTLARARTALGDRAGGLAANEQAAELARTAGSPSLVRKVAARSGRRTGGLRRSRTRLCPDAGGARQRPEPASRPAPSPARRRCRRAPLSPPEGSAGRGCAADGGATCANAGRAVVQSRLTSHSTVDHACLYRRRSPSAPFANWGRCRGSMTAAAAWQFGLGPTCRPSTIR